MEKDLNTKVKQFHEDVAERGEDVVFRVFPSKIFELQEIIQSMDDPSSPFSLSNLTGNTDTTVYPPMVQYETLNWNDVNVNDTKYAKHPSIVYDNPGIQKINEVISKKIEEMVLLVEQVEVWIILTIPKIEDGDNFGVQVQEKVLEQLLSADKSAAEFRNAALEHHLDRAKICSKLCKYPNVKDYARALEEHDKRQIYSARERLREIQNIYAILADVIQKNILKIRVPKANHGGSYSSWVVHLGGYYAG